MEEINYDIEKELLGDLPKNSKEEIFSFIFDRLDSPLAEDGETNFKIEAVLTEEKLSELTEVNLKDNVDIKFEWKTPFHINITKEVYEQIKDDERFQTNNKIYFLEEENDLPLDIESNKVKTYNIENVINEAINVIQEANNFLKSQS